MSVRYTATWYDVMQAWQQEHHHTQTVLDNNYMVINTPLVQTPERCRFAGISAVLTCHDSAVLRVQYTQIKKRPL